jgi:hypothetical protein
MANEVMINFRGSEQLAEAIRVVAFNQGHSKSSEAIRNALETNPEIAKELKKIKSRKKVVA